MVSKLFSLVGVIFAVGITFGNEAVAQEIHGSVRFEMRHTIVTQFCESLRTCPKSQPYWALILDSDKYKYEVNQRYSMGSEQAPDSVSIAGIVVHEGEILNLDGTVEYVSEDYAYVDNIRRSNSEANSISEELAAETHILPNWTCRGEMAGPSGQTSEVVTDIWYTMPGIHQAGGYRAHLSVTHFDGTENKKIDVANLYNVQGRRERELMVYEGNNPSVTFTLNIEDSHTYRNVSGMLKLSVLRDAIDQATTEAIEVQVKCTENR